MIRIIPLLIFFVFIDFQLQGQKISSYADSLDASISYTEYANYRQALDILLPLAEKNPDDLEINYWLGYNMLYSKDKKEALAFIERLYFKALQDKSSNKKILQSIQKLLAQAYLHNYEMEKARTMFENMKKRTVSKTEKLEIDEYIQLTYNAEKYIKNPRQVKISLVEQINSPYYDHSPLLSADQSIIFFTSRRPDGVSGAKLANDSMYYEDIYMLDLNMGADAKPQSLMQPINTEEHDATCSISLDGQEMLIFKSTTEDQGDIYYSRLINKEWSKPARLGPPINSKYKESHAAFSPDRKAIYFTSNRPGGKGGMDIYVAYRRPIGGFSLPVNLGEKINTYADEEGPYMHANGKTLYFSSKGHESMGGFDVFYAEADTAGNWNEPVNMGFPLNTIFDDVFLVPSVDGRTAYYSSMDEGSSNIYKAEIIDEPVKPLTLLSGFAFRCEVDTFLVPIEDALVIGNTLQFGKKTWVNKQKSFINDGFSVCHFFKNELEYIVVDSFCQNPPNTKISIFKLDDFQMVDEAMLSNKTGKYQFVMNSAHEYLVNYTSPGHVQRTGYIPAGSTYNQLNINAQLDTLNEHNKYKRPIIFPVTEIQLTKRSKLELSLLSEFLKMNPELYVDISLKAKNAVENQERKLKVAEELLKNGVQQKGVFYDLWENQWGQDTIQLTIFSANYPGLEALVAVKEEQTKMIEEVKAEEAEKPVISLPKKEEALLPKENEPEYQLVLESILFDKAKAEPKITTDKLMLLANYLRNNPETILMLEGHADMQGDEAFNQKLSLNRAVAVWNFLVEKGVGREQLVIRPMGAKYPIAKETDLNGNVIQEARSYNRRVDFIVVSDKGGILVKPIEVPEKYRIKK